MTPTGFEPVKGKRFTFQTTPGGAWDGVIHCEVLEVIPNERLVFSWKSGNEGKRRIRLAARHGRHVHSRGSKTERAFASYIQASCFRRTRQPSGTWAKAGRRSSRSIGAISGEEDSSKEAELRRASKTDRIGGWGQELATGTGRPTRTVISTEEINHAG